MALTFSANKSNIQRTYYTVYMRETGTAIQSSDYADLTSWNAFLALFTEIGWCENKNTKLTTVPSDEVELHNGEKHYLAVQGNFECKFLQSAVADDTALADMSGKDCDLLLVDDTAKKWVYMHNKRFKVEENIVSGEIESSRIYHEQSVPSADEYRDKGPIPVT